MAPRDPVSASQIWGYLRRASRYLRGYRRLAVAAGAMMVVSTLIGLLAPWPLKILVDSVLQDHPLPGPIEPLLQGLSTDRVSLLVVVVVAGFAMTLATNGLAVLDNYVGTTIHENLVLDFRSDLFQHAQRLSLAYHDQRRTGKVIFAINNLGTSAAGLVMAVPPIAQAALMLGGMLWVSLTIDATLTLLALSVVPLIYYAIGYYMAHIQRRLNRVKGMEAESLSMIHEAMQMLRVVTAFGREHYEFRRFRDHGERTVSERISVTVQQTAFSLFVNTSTALGTALVLGVGGHFTLQERLTVGQLLVVMAYIGMVYKPLEQITKGVSAVQEKVVGLRTAYGLLDEEPEIRNRPGARVSDTVRGDITFEHVSFSYRGRQGTLHDISFHVPAGRAVAIVGPTGAGKTTLVSLIPRFYEPSNGCVRLDGTDVQELTLESLRQRISIVLQEPLLFAGTIADNIRYGRLDATMDEVIDAILDEPTSSVDAKTESVILDALDRLMVGRTTFIVAHRLSTVRHADMILVLRGGELVEQGSHAELVRGEGLYQQLYEMQTRKGRPPARPDVAGAPRPVGVETA